MRTSQRKTPANSYSINTRTAGPANKGRILFVDDEKAIREIARVMLKTTGYEIATAADGVKALDLLDSGQKFDLLLCNFMMPRLDGLGVLERTKSKYPDMPFVLHSAVYDISVALAALRNGAYDYLHVPFEREQLLAVVNRALEYRRLKIENRRLKARLAKATNRKRK